MADREQLLRILALVGMPGSGKSLCAQYLQARGFFQFRFGSIVEDEVRRRGWEVQPENERIVREEMRVKEGMDVMAKRALPILKCAIKERGQIVIDGLYSFSEYKSLQKEFGDELVVIAIVCARYLRYERLARRSIRPLTREEAQRRDWLEIENLEKGGPIAIADYTLINDQAPEILFAKLDHLLEQLDFYPG